jgi:hypothetical protein
MRTTDAGTGAITLTDDELLGDLLVTELHVDLPARLLDEEFGAGGVMRFEDVDFPATLTHEPTRRFLRETGLPEDGVIFQLEMDVPLSTLAEHYAAEWTEQAVVPEGQRGQLPEGADRLIRLGSLGHRVEGTDLLVDGRTGIVHEWSAPGAGLRPLNADISILAFTLWLLHHAKMPEAVTGFEPA